MGEIPGGSTNIANRPDDSDVPELATVVGMNSIIQGNIETPGDIDVFRINSVGNSAADGILEITLLEGHPGVGFLRGPVPIEEERG